MLFSSVKRLHSLELYDDLLLLVELNLQEHRLPSQLAEEEQAIVFSCVGDAHFECSHYAQSIRYYEKAIRTITSSKQRGGGKMRVGELRFKMHKALLLGENKVEEALRCLEAIPKGELTPKVSFAIGKLTLLTQKPVMRGGGAMSMAAMTSQGLNSKVASSFHCVLDEVPEALLCRSYLISGHQQLNDNNAFIESITISDECKAWLMAKELESQKKFTDAANILMAIPCGNLRLVIELARYLHLSGDRSKALHHYQRAHSLDAANTHGMDALCFLLANEEKELEQLAGKLLTHNGQECAEVFMAYGHLARIQHKQKEALQFAHRAVSLSSQGKQRAFALLLKGQLLLDGKRIKDADSHLQECLLNDNTNIEAYEVYIKCLVGQKRFSEAHRLIKNAFISLGEDNPRIHYLHAYILSEDNSMKELNEAVRILDEVTAKAPHIIDAVLLLSKLYDRLQLPEKAIAMLERHIQSSVTTSSTLHRMLGDYLAKTNKPEQACSELRQSLSHKCPDPKALQSMAELNAMPGLATTPECPASAAAFNSSGRAPPMAPTKAKRAAHHHDHHAREG